MQLPRKMSAQNVMASISRTLGTRHDSNSKHSNEVKLAGEESKDKLYEPKHRQKVVRVLTVVAYVVSVSLAAIILSLYYTFIWDPKDHAHYAIRKNTFNSTAKVECLNMTIPLIADVAGGNGSRVTRISTQPTGNNSEPLEKLRTSFPPEDPAPIEIVPDPASDEEQVSKSAASIVPAVVQPDPESIQKKEESNDRITQDGDFGFI